jgi:hypothetical protein
MNPEDEDYPEDWEFFDEPNEFEIDPQYGSWHSIFNQPTL